MLKIIMFIQSVSFKFLAFISFHTRGTNSLSISQIKYKKKETEKNQSLYLNDKLSIQFLLYSSSWHTCEVEKCYYPHCEGAAGQPNRSTKGNDLPIVTPDISKMTGTQTYVLHILDSYNLTRGQSFSSYKEIAPLVMQLPHYLH